MTCKTTFADRPSKPLGDMRLSPVKATLCLRLLVEGDCIRSAMRVSGVNRTTIIGLLTLVGERCKRLLEAISQAG